MISVCDVIHSACRRHGSRVALQTVSGAAPQADSYRTVGSLTYGELYDRTLRFGDALVRRLGMRPGDRVAVLLDNSAEMVVSEWACLLGGHLWVALNARSSAHEHELLLADSAPRVLLVAEKYQRTIAGIALPASCRVVVVGPDGQWRRLLEEAEPRLPARAPGPEDPVRIRYTSGTAGLPKGAVLPRRCYDASFETVGELLGPLHEDDVLAQVAPMTHAAGAMWLPHAAAGARALLVEHFHEGAFVGLVERAHVSAAFLVPTMLVRLIETLQGMPARQAASRMRSLRSIVYGGAAMPVDRLRKGLELLGPVFVQIYGLTESNWPATALRREEHIVDGTAEAQLRRLTSCGRPTPVGELRIVDERGRDLAAGQVGQILLRGANTMKGYWGKDGDAGDEAGKGLDAGGWMHTGDVAVRDERGFITIVDRLHDMIVSGGFNVYPREVENALSSHPAVLEAAVVGLPSALWGEVVHAAVVLRPGAAASEDELAVHVAQQTAAYKKPRSFEFVSELPRNAAGKVLRRVLRDFRKTTKPPA
ncbi:MAG: AMP-binding protein [Deltaproteobacteria bacterium]|nr:AMP-binding protein [Deltaproteobacteria bacterium]